MHDPADVAVGESAEYLGRQGLNHIGRESRTSSTSTSRTSTSTSTRRSTSSGSGCCADMVVHEFLEVVVHQLEDEEHAARLCTASIRNQAGEEKKAEREKTQAVEARAERKEKRR